MHGHSSARLPQDSERKTKEKNKLRAPHNDDPVSCRGTSGFLFLVRFLLRSGFDYRPYAAPLTIRRSNSQFFTHVT